MQIDPNKSPPEDHFDLDLNVIPAEAKLNIHEEEHQSDHNMTGNPCFKKKVPLEIWKSRYSDKESLVS